MLGSSCAALYMHFHQHNYIFKVLGVLTVLRKHGTCFRFPQPRDKYAWKRKMGAEIASSACVGANNAREQI